MTTGALVIRGRNGYGHEVCDFYPETDDGDGDDERATYFSVSVESNGCLVIRDDDDDVVAAYAPGSWQVYYQEHERPGH